MMRADAAPLGASRRGGVRRAAPAGNQLLRVPIHAPLPAGYALPARDVRAALLAAVAAPPAAVDAAQQRARAPEHSPEGAEGPFPVAHTAAQLAPQPAHAAADGHDQAFDTDMEDADAPSPPRWGEPVALSLGPFTAQGVAPEAQGVDPEALLEAQRVATETKKLSPSTADYAAARRTLEQSQCYIAQLAAAAARHRPAEQEALQPAESLEHGAIVIDDEEEVVAPVRVAQPARGTGLSRDTAINLCSDDDEE